VDQAQIQFKKTSLINFGTDKDGDLRDLLKMTEKSG
jgi:hypothetical protein